MNVSEIGGLNTGDWARLRRQVLITGSYDPNDYDTYSQYQKQWLRDTINTLRDLSRSENYSND